MVEGISISDDMYQTKSYKTEVLGSQSLHDYSMSASPKSRDSNIASHNSYRTRKGRMLQPLLNRVYSISALSVVAYCITKQETRPRFVIQNVFIT